MMIFIQKISIVLDYEPKNSCRLFSNCLSKNTIIALVVSLPFIFAMLTTLTVIWPAVYAYNAMETAGDNHGQLSFISTMMKTTTNASSSLSIENATNNTMTQIPESARGPTIPEKGYLVEEIRDNLFWVTDGSYNTIFLVTDEGVVAVDAPPSIGQNYLKAIAEVTDKPITHIIYSHAHLDHIGAAGIFPKNATYIAHQDTSAELKRAMSLTRNDSTIPPVPTITFPNNYTLQIGNQTLELSGSCLVCDYDDNHMPGNTFIYAPNQNTLMLVDVVFPGWVPFAYLAITEDVAGFIKAHDIVLNNYDFDTFVGGHLTKLGTRDDVITQQEFVSDLRKAATKANSEVQFSDIATQVGNTNDTWLLYSKYIDAVNKNCVQTMLPKWESRLGGAESFMPTHCFAMTQAGRVSPSVSAILQNSTMAAPPN
jgi:glyoxylase-like metal-dependent hydrolase (beta-lactamase superfamily II)